MGCANIASLSNPIPPRQALATLRAAFDRGINFFDTADSYGQGRSEQLIGEAFKAERHKVIIETKAGFTFGAVGKSAALFKDVIKTAARYIPGAGNAILRLRRSTQRQDFSPEYIRSAVEASLTRLNTDYIDILMLHSPPYLLERQDEVVETLDSLKREGKILRYGVAMESLEPGSHPFLPGAVYQVPLVASGMQALADADRLNADSSFIVARGAFSYCRAESERDAAFRERLNHISDDFYAASLISCLQDFPLGVLLVGMTRPESVLRNAAIFDRIPGGVIDLEGTP